MKRPRAGKEDKLGLDLRGRQDRKAHNADSKVGKLLDWSVVTFLTIPPVDRCGIIRHSHKIEETSNHEDSRVSPRGYPPSCIEKCRGP